jgi:hypothetical protein
MEGTREVEGAARGGDALDCAGAAAREEAVAGAFRASLVLSRPTVASVSSVDIGFQSSADSAFAVDLPSNVLPMAGRGYASG